MKIFLLEDDFSLNKIIKLSLQNKGFFVDSFTDGYKAVDVILNSTYDLYILDLNVLGFDGHKVLEFIRKDYLKIIHKILAITLQKIMLVIIIHTTIKVIATEIFLSLIN